MPLFLVGSPPSIVLLGDSTICNNGADMPAVTTLLPYPNRMFVDLSSIGDSITQQQTKWSALSSFTKSNIKTVILQIGLADRILTFEADSTMTSRFQTLINTIAADVPSAKILAAKLTPCAGFDRANAGDATQRLSRWNTLNNAIAGTGTTLTGLTARITDNSDLLNDGTGALLSQYAISDLAHENTLGRQVVANAWVAVLSANNLPT